MASNASLFSNVPVVIIKVGKPLVASCTFPMVGKNVYVFNEKAVPFAQANVDVVTSRSELVFPKN